MRWEAWGRYSKGGCCLKARPEKTLEKLALQQSLEEGGNKQGPSQGHFVL